MKFFFHIKIMCTLVLFLMLRNGIQASPAKDMMDRAEARQKVRTNTGYSGGKERVRRRKSRGQDCNVDVGNTYVESRRGGREVNVYTYTGDIDVRCN